MTYKQVENMVASIGLPYAYYEFKTTDQAPPFVCYFYTDSRDFTADGINYQRIRPCRLELYTDYKDFALECQIETVLNQHGLLYVRNEGYLDTERMNMVTYDFDVVVTENDENEV